MMLLYKVDPTQVVSSVTPVPLNKMVDLFAFAVRALLLEIPLTGHMDEG